GSMSGGEKARLVLCMMVWQRPNLLLLDEPTNHLDLATREALAMALNEFEGTLMLVSHDRALLRSVCDEFWLVTRGGVEPFDGDLDDYQKFLLEEAKRSREAVKEEQQALKSKSIAEATASAKANSKPAKLQKSVKGEKTKNLSPLKKELQQVDDQLAALNHEGKDLENRLAKPLQPADLAQAGKRLKTVQQEIEALEAKWLELSQEIENAAA
ncbi:MAG TPA: ATP-binding cassette domain-containing protein, partial [Burkholderiaceae bacterium]|nr:ATP-binding cassette domain-containing protein [Burkholderiaceae bacterium]